MPTIGEADCPMPRCHCLEGCGAQRSPAAEFINAQPIGGDGEGGIERRLIVAEEKMLAGGGGSAAGALAGSPSEGDEGEVILAQVPRLNEQPILTIEPDARMAGKGIGDPQWPRRGHD